ncbi:MAG: DUF3320 domain-containing protein [Lentisphaeria bacterium]|nr:DUF3320 domain-containing protein [Lentisphaeria bacterium]
MTENSISPELAPEQISELSPAATPTFSSIAAPSETAAAQQVENAAAPQLTAELDFLPSFNLAFQQNGVPAVRELKLTNRSDRPLAGLVCTFTSSPEMILPKTIHAEAIAPGETLAMHDLGIELNCDYLTALSEAVKGKLKLEVFWNGQTVFRQDYDVTAFAADQWTGRDVMPELLAAFVTPNLDVISELQARASEELRKVTGDASIDGYRSGDRKRVYEICAAIYRAVYSWGIHYSLPPSSIGTPGQRIRFSDNIYQYKLGTCLDTTVLFASVMEQCGLNPVIMIHTSHAYIGCHLVDRYFPDIPMDDLQAVRKLVDLDEFLVLETTSVCSGDSASFSRAEAIARKHLNNDDEFQCAVDICRARRSGIRPLPLRRSVDGLELAPVEHDVDKLAPEEMRPLQQDVDLSSLEDAGTQSGRVRRWTQKLLDMSLRNRLLNVRDTKQIIPIACTDITVLEDKLAADESIALNALANLLNEKDIHDLATHRESEISTEIRALLDAELDQHRLWSILPPPELNKRLVAVYRQSKSDLEEGGVNTLFLAIGFLEWKQTERDAKSFLAPILLIPIQIRRKSVAEGFRISRLDEETMINETLLELLRSQFQLTVPGLDPLPTDDSGVDVGRVMRIFRQTLKDMKGWEVREEARIGLFSFGKFIMWNDMTARQDDLRRNAVVNHLIEGGGLFDDGIEVFPPEEIAQHLDLKNLCCPMSADSSQLTAVVYSGLGKSFVLHGPPGTGKSQTITNIIAQNLALGRRVLFVSEKKAALDVVHNRLSKIGLKPFCLELHSNKAGKTDVLKQFAEALQIPEIAPPAEWNAVIASMEQTREELNRYVRELHNVYPNGLSAYDCFSRTLLMTDAPDPALVPEIDFLTQSREECETAERLASDLAISFQGTSPDALEAMRILDPVPWSPVLENEILKSARTLVSAADTLKESFAAVAPLLRMPPHSANIPAIRKTAELAALFPSVRDIPSSLVCAQFPAHAEFLKKYLADDRRRAGLENKLNAYRLDTFPQYDFPGIAARVEENDRAFFLVKFFKNNSLLKELAALKKSGGAKLTVSELKALLPEAEEYNGLLRTLESGRAQAEDLLGAYWNAGSPDWNAVEAMLTDAEQVMAVASEFADTEALYEALRGLLPDAKHSFSEYLPAIQNLQVAEKGFLAALDDFAAHSSAAPSMDNLDGLRDSVQAVIDRISDLRAALRYLVLAKEARERGLAKLAAALENGTVAPDGFAEFCGDVFASVMLAQILTASPVLSQFDGATHNDRIRKFSELDDKYTALARKLVFAKLAASLPRRRSGPCPEGTELGLLKRECEKRARQKPVRQLLEQIPTLAPILKPCFLMSPLSVAQYLPPDAALFDLIVFDEASQIPVWDAIGVIARGRQLIVVGDPKQMPPTNFFQKQDSEDADDAMEDAADLESILDECIAAGVYPTYLNWHYRSRHESLIAFSNHYYYEDRLFTFPAATVSDRLGVRFVFVQDGVYDRKSTRTNRKEAEAVVEYVFDRLAHSHKKRSIGVVTFSQAQKDLIEDLMEEEREKHPELEPYFSDKNPEPPFVKNLENVQGDERDVILFSIGYAPDASGKFAMNFGPLNRQGGERRLNVAITRAKEQVVVFSSIHASQIDLARTGAVGAAHLKYFLDYAEKGIRIQHKNDADAAGNGLAVQIAGFLAEHGYESEHNFGSSEYRIDLAVRNPDRPDQFLLAIECDGSSYAAQRTTRDREHLRPSVLQSLGWHTYRAWSVDWAFARKHAEQDLLHVLDEIRNTPEAPEPETEPEPEPENGPEQVPGETAAEPDAGKKTETSPAPVQSASQFRKDYVVWRPAKPLNPDLFYAPESRALIRRQIREIIQTEGPIYGSLLKKRITKAWGFARAGGNIAAVLRDCMPDKLTTTSNADEPVYWPGNVSPADYRDYRIGTDRDAKRAIDEIPPEELANAMHEILVDFASCEQDVLFRETIRLFGLNTLTAKARQYLEYAVAVLQRSGRI